MLEENVKRRIQRLFRTLVIGAAVVAPQAGCTDDEATTPTDSGIVDDDSGDTDGGGPKFW